MEKFKRIIKEIKARPLALAAVSFGFFVVITVIMALIYSAVSQPPTQIDVLVAPSDAVIKVGDNTYTNGRYDIGAGEYRVEITKDDFEPYEGTLTVKPGEVTELHVYLKQSDGGYDYYIEHPEETSVITTIADKEADRASAEALAANTILAYIPFTSQGLGVRYRIDPAFDGTILTGLVISINTCLDWYDFDSSKENALEWLRSKGENPDNYAIEYQSICIKE
jgi:hypothetical protein